MLCIGVATVLSQALPLQRSYWVPLTVAVVLRPDLGSVFARALQSAAGTVIGASVGALILASRPPDPLAVIWLALFALALPYGLSRNYGLFTVSFAPLVVLLINQALPSEPSLRPVTDAVRYVADALDGMPPQRRPSLIIWNTRHKYGNTERGRTAMTEQIVACGSPRNLGMPNQHHRAVDRSKQLGATLSVPGH